MLSKLVTAGLLAAVADDRERNRYRLIHSLVRSDGLGDWVQALDEVLVGPPSQQLLEAASDDRRSLTEKFTSGTWQHEAVQRLYEVLRTVASGVEQPTIKVPLRHWFAGFANLRNKTRAHGATTPATCARLCPLLEQSIKMVIDNLPLLQRPWAYLHRNLSGKYRVVSLGGNTSSFDQLKIASGAGAAQYRNLNDGVYIDFQEFVRVEVMDTNVDVADFFFPNGAFTGKTFELLSLISDNRKQGDASPYLAPASERPISETQGKGTLDVVGKTWTNLPSASTGYVSRPALEEELYQALINDRHPVITLVGRGGIGKTSLAITVLHRVACEGFFDVIIWFSARDIDLLPQGPRVVTPRVLSQTDIADEFVRFLDPAEAKQKGFNPLGHLASSLTTSPTGKPILFVFDNFETVRNPNDVFAWLDTRIRLPNKILVTTRYREFKADYPVAVSGMTKNEADQLIDATAQRLGITGLLTSQYRGDIYEEADGHPYIIKVLLGEVAKARKLVKVERIVAGRDEILDALFERTYAGLQPVAKRVFLTLCSWRSLVPQMAVQAVLLRPSNERMDVDAAVEELVRSSFVERTEASDGTAFLDIALVAAVFGRKKLEITEMKAAIDADVEWLQQIGATNRSALRHGVRPRIEKFFQNIAVRITSGRERLETVIPILEFVCRQYPQGWLLLAKLHEETEEPERLIRAAECLRRFLQDPPTIPDQRVAWEELARIHEAILDWMGAAHAHISKCKLPGTPFSVLSNTANWLNNLFRDNYLAIDSDEKRLLYQDLAQLIKRRINEADATDLSRLAWLYLHLHNVDRALEIVEEGLKLDPQDEHCLKLKTRLQRREGAFWAR